MTEKMTSSRRSFLKSGVVVGTPIVVAAVPAAALADDGSRGKLARLEAERTVDALHRTWMHKASLGQVHGLSGNVSALRLRPGAEIAQAELSDCGQFAIARQQCIVEIDEEPEEDCTVIQMARLQGNRLGFREEDRILKVRYSNCSEQGWHLREAELI